MFGFFKKKQPAQPDIEENGTLEQVVPRIKHVEFLGAIEEMAREAGGAADRPVTTPLVGDLIVAYAFDLPHSFQMVMAHDLERLGVSADQIRERAIANLHEKLPNVNAFSSDEQPSVIGIQTGENLEACILLMPKFLNKAAAALPGGRLVAAVPNRSLIMFTHDRSASGLEVLRDVIRLAETESDPTHNLTRHLLVWVDRQWQVLE